MDDFIVSPPSLDDGGFLRLRYGRTCTTQPSLQSQDGGMTVEVKDDTLQFSPDTTPTNTATISIGPGGLSVEPSPTTTPLTTPETKAENPEVHPLLVLPMNFGGGAASGSSESLGSAAAPTSKGLSSTTSLECIGTQSNTLLERVQSLSLTTTPSHSVPASPLTSPFTTPKNSPTFGRKRMVGVAAEPQRKISAHSYFCTPQPQYNQDPSSMAAPVKQERKISAHSYFCTKPMQDNQGVLNTPATLKEEVSVNKQQLEDGVIIEPPKYMGQRRRQPKPSALREMNFWAPTSM